MDYVPTNEIIDKLTLPDYAKIEWEFGHYYIRPKNNFKRFVGQQYQDILASLRGTGLFVDKRALSATKGEYTIPEGYGWRIVRASTVEKADSLLPS
jgi:hypothetical protein